MPHSTWRCNFGPSGQSPTFVAQRPNIVPQLLISPRYKLRSSPILCTATAPVEVNESVHVGNTPYGRGLLCRKDVPSGKRLLSVPFHQLLLLPDKVDSSFESIQERFLRDHGELPLDLLRFIQGLHSIFSIVNMQLGAGRSSRSDWCKHLTTTDQPSRRS